MRLNEIKPIYCNLIPESIEFGFIYISLKYSSSTHLCACGCGIVTVLPIGDPSKGVYWTITQENKNWGDPDIVSFSPSVGNDHSGCPTKAHYHIRKNKIEWY